MDRTSSGPSFMPFVGASWSHELSEPRFTPVAHDLVVLSPKRGLVIAPDASISHIITTLDNSNRDCAAVNHGVVADDAALLAVIRFDKADADDEAPSQSSDDWSQLWPFFDPCGGNGGNPVDFVTRLRQADSDCPWSISEDPKRDGLHSIECSKLIYCLAPPDKCVLIAHHFHRDMITGETKEMVRMVTCGVSQEKLGEALSIALPFADQQGSGSGDASPESVLAPNPIPHPVAILYGMLVTLEGWCREQIDLYRRRVMRIDNDTADEHDPRKRRPKRLEINHMRLSEASFRLGEVLKKLQHLLCSIVTLQGTSGLPSATGDGASNTPANHLAQKWQRQLRAVQESFPGLKTRAEQHKINIANLLERIKGMDITVSILIQEREKNWNRQAIEKQLSMIKFQNKMLQAQDIIVRQTKRDNTVMKVIAVLTSLFLPGAFMATLFSMPILKWDEEDPMGPHFMTYWYFTGPITATLVVGLSVWFVMMWLEDRREKIRLKQEQAKEDPERANRSGSDTSSSDDDVVTDPVCGLSSI